MYLVDKTQRNKCSFFPTLFCKRHLSPIQVQLLPCQPEYELPLTNRLPAKPREMVFVEQIFHMLCLHFMQLIYTDPQL